MFGLDMTFHDGDCVATRAGADIRSGVTARRTPALKSDRRGLGSRSIGGHRKSSGMEKAGRRAGVGNCASGCLCLRSATYRAVRIRLILLPDLCGDGVSQPAVLSTHSARKIVK